MTYKNIHEFRCDFCKKTVKCESPLLPLEWILTQENMEDDTTEVHYFCSKNHLASYIMQGKESNGVGSRGRRIKEVSGN